jgi:AraC-like DNA-binding protein
MAQFSVSRDIIRTLKQPNRTNMSIDRLSNLLTHFRIRTELFQNGALCGVTRIPAKSGTGYLHILREGHLRVEHPAGTSVQRSLHIREPSLLFYPQALAHRFHNPPREESMFACAQLHYESQVLHPLLSALPALIVLPLRDISGIEASLTLLFAEADRARCGQVVLLDRLFEVLLIYLLRWLLDHPERVGVNEGMLKAMSEPAIARVLVALHESPGERWTLEAMAEKAHLSRTSFAERFRMAMGETPAEYLSHWRVRLAQAGLLRGESLKALASTLGYANPTALSRVFTAKMGISPRDWLVSTQKV